MLNIELTMSTISKLIAGGIAALILTIYGLGGITHIDPGEVGILVKNLGSNPGMQRETLSIGTHWVEPFFYDVVVYNARCRQMQEEPEEVAAGTADGQPVNVDFTIQLCLNAQQVPDLHQQMGPTYYDGVIHPAIIKTVKDNVPSEPSDVIYTAKGRLNVESAINKEIDRRFGKDGVRVEINLRDILFTNKQYVAILEEKARASQQVEVNTRKAQAAVQEAIRIANVAEGQKQARIKAAEAQKEEQRLAGEGGRLAKEEQAKGNLALALAEAQGVAAKRQALEGVGGERMVQLEWAKQLGPNVKVWGVPTGAPGTATFMDLNQVLKGAFKGD